jgi:hypothetical protein
VVGAQRRQDTGPVVGASVDRRLVEVTGGELEPLEPGEQGEIGGRRRSRGRGGGDLHERQL